MDRVINIEGVGTRSAGLLNSRNMAVTSRGHWTTKLTSGQHHLLESVDRGIGVPLSLQQTTREGCNISFFLLEVLSLPLTLSQLIFFPLKHAPSPLLDQLYPGDFSLLSPRLDTSGLLPLFPHAFAPLLLPDFLPASLAFNFHVCFPDSCCVSAAKRIDLSALPVFGSCLFAPHASRSSALKCGFSSRPAAGWQAPMPLMTRSCCGAEAH